MKKGFGGLLMLLGTFVGVNTYAQKPAVVISNEPGWHKIGEITADFNMDSESISVHGADEFTAIKLKVTDASLNIERLQVFYESGDMEEINLRSQINENAESSVINLKHPDRDIQKVTFTYKTVPNATEDKAEVELYGLKTNQPQGRDTYRDERREADEDIDRATDNTERDLKKAGDDVERKADEVGDDVEREADEVGDDVKREANEAEAEMKEEGDKVENKTKEVLKDVESDIKDEKVEGKESPSGETVYIDEKGKYYYIDNAGNKVFIAKELLKDKPNK